MARKTIIEEGEYYHVYNRGVDKRIIFERDQDYQRFIAMLHLCNSTKPVEYRLSDGYGGLTSVQIPDKERIVAIGAYALMPNHFHLLLREICAGGIAKFMQKLSTGYTMYFNLTRDRNGSLFQGSFKAQHSDSDEYLKYLFSYIHLNPVELARANEDRTKFLLSYPYSSYQDFLGKTRAHAIILNKSEFPDYFSTQEDFEHNINDWLANRPQDFNTEV